MGSLLPPPQYDHLPAIEVIENVLNFEQLEPICGGNAWACSNVQRDAAGNIKVCTIYLPAVGSVILGKDRHWFPERGKA
jgi:hypothetical protein